MTRAEVLAELATLRDGGALDHLLEADDSEVDELSVRTSLTAHHLVDSVGGSLALLVEDVRVGPLVV